MAEPALNNAPPALTKGPNGAPETASLADLVEWFITHDERVARVRHPYSDELFKWKQEDDTENGVATYPFENAEARFAIGVIQAAAENNTEELLKAWITDVVEALGRAKEAKEELTGTYNLDADAEAFALKKAEKLPSAVERRLYLSSCWLDLLCTAEARVLGWIYQELYGKPFAP
ncbi:MAG: hypothetical protein UZ17_ACD001002729 [Acidobacteria bacterium OLB17]|nr:MAG: hypothetical protein UZ17_ACD001002729 [Acidobacteria bacterium OLB17]MCZ2390456.1 hypothetical protein [Acidobacteriota bacterium]